ncbi:MAG: hypothetical protein IJU95_02890, partial [Treponema sp.]|nr:hypothetical protein [Treponema sp.]
MVFLILNVILAVSLILFSFAIDSTSSGSSKDGNPLVNTVLFLASLFIMMAITVGFCLFAPQKLAFSVGKLTYVLMAWFAVHNAVYVLCFPDGKKGRAGTIVRWVLNLSAFIIIFFIKNAITNLSITQDGSFQIASGLMFSGKLGRALMVTWFKFYNALFIFFVPFIACIMLIVKAENSKSAMLRQKYILCIAGVLSSMGIFLFINYSAIYQPM